LKRDPLSLKHVLFLASLLHLAGCTDDRKRVAGDVFLCNASSHTADFDCGDGYVCYSGAQSLGESVCVASCDPERAAKTCPAGACTVAHECLTRCTVGAKNACGGEGILSCVRTTYSPLEAADGKDGVCIPVAFTCETSDDCGSPIFNLCTSETNGQQDNDTLLKSGSVCAQGNCARDGVACEPGSTCIKKVLPTDVSDTPDVCTPNCLRRQLPGDGGVVEECPIGFSCLDQVFPQTSTRVCAPGFPGWICQDPLGCAAGSCAPWQDVGGPFNGFNTCSPACQNDDDCLIYDRAGNANVLSHFTCVSGQCRHLQSLFFTEICLEGDRPCRLDPEARCVNPPHPAADAGTAADDPCSLSAMAGATSESAACVRDCGSNADCATLTNNAHVTYTCVGGSCVPAVPFIFPCGDDSGCMPGLHCLPAPAGGGKVCSLSCQTPADCAANPALGSGFACALGICVPKTASGCAPPAPARELCLSGIFDDSDGRCKSPKGWACDNDDQHPGYPARCQSGKCSAGHCQ
jgi:hypothetical protein